MRVGGQRHASAALPPGMTRYPLHRRLGGPQGRSGRVWKISPPPGLDPRTVQSVAIRYTDWAIPAYLRYKTFINLTVLGGRGELCAFSPTSPHVLYLETVDDLEAL